MSTADRVPPLTSSNNFIFDRAITDVIQVQGGSCNPASMDAIASTLNMPSSGFTFPEELCHGQG